jgi:hypothetical protein
MKCNICEKESKNGTCDQCAYFKKHGADEKAIKAMYADPHITSIWKETIGLSEALGQAYYDTLLDNYPEDQVKKSSQEEFGFNTFSDGIRLGLDVIMPLLDKKSLEAVKAKIASMLEAAEIRKKR